VRSFAVFRDLLGAAALTGVVAMAFSLSLRGAVPNLAVVPLAALAGGLFAATAGQAGVIGGAARALAVTAAVGLVMGALVVGFRVPAWAASVAAALLATGLAILVTPVAGAVTSGPDLTGADLPLFGAFAAVSVTAGLLCLIPAVRRTLGAYRRDDGAARRGVLPSVVAVLVLVLSSVVAGAGGLLVVFSTHAVSIGSAAELWLPLAAVLVGGASVLGRRVGVTGTVLGVLLLTALQQFWVLSGLRPGPSGAGAVLALAGVAAIVGLLATPLVEWAGRRAEARMSP
jgi:ribose/xylose/arabinose/galactoside ABC-type transport system permease subunit